MHFYLFTEGLYPNKQYVQDLILIEHKVI